MRSSGLVAAAALAFALSACSAPVVPPEPSVPAAIAAPEGSERGAIVSAMQLGQVDIGVAYLGGTAFKIVYRTTDGVSGGGTETSGTVFVPRGSAPAGGWPIVSVGHGTTGVTDECAPSLYPNLLGTVGLVTPFLERGTVVVVTDYQGLGTPGDPAYLDRDAAAYDVIDAVRAARNVVPDVGTRWGAVGTSQGGQAVWAAAERNADYGDGLQLVGAAALSPVADATRFFAPETEQTLARQLLVPYLVEGLHAVESSVDRSDYIRGSFADNVTALTACSDLLGFSKADAGAVIDPADALPATDQAANRMSDWLASVALPKSRTEVPLLVLIGERDDLIDPQWTRAAATKACALGDDVELRSEPQQGHADLAANGIGVDWLVERFLNVPTSSTCVP
ncbi:alpha/beta hydrolase [Rhodococcus sp. IEGM 1381]|uniref:alpha/beta hydrolase family protein n=1 Tax=Rhodococcus sp. IEGM 1381 TaxID=3047085 RepID=UPI0024B7C9BD|nr:alpha/beta hydrolase [Rhodococcus sp. IEGM 1381]MDI9894888.1 alpha/beta hydrolase [Rhodococcus sp. IEGM 1381]